MVVILLFNIFFAFILFPTNILTNNNRLISILKTRHNYYHVYNYEKKNKFSKNILKTTNNINTDILDNEIKYLLNKNVKILLHLEQLFQFTNIYHIGITFKSIYKEVRYDIIGLELINTTANRDLKVNKTIFWDYSNKSINDIIEYEDTMQFNYILGFNDCRHYVRNLTYWACNNPTPIWKLKNLIN